MGKNPPFSISSFDHTQSVYKILKILFPSICTFIHRHAFPHTHSLSLPLSFCLSIFLPLFLSISAFLPLSLSLSLSLSLNQRLEKIVRFQVNPKNCTFERLKHKLNVAGVSGHREMVVYVVRFWLAREIKLQNKLFCIFCASFLASKRWKVCFEVRFFNLFP